MHEHETEQRVSCLTHLPSFCCFTILFNNPVMFLLLQYTNVGHHNILLQMVGVSCDDGDQSKGNF